MIVNILVSLASTVVSALALLVVSRGTSITQHKLREANDRDRLIDAMAWVDRAVFHTPVSSHENAARKHEFCE
jgi:hypothetical protein